MNKSTPCTTRKIFSPLRDSYPQNRQLVSLADLLVEAYASVREGALSQTLLIDHQMFGDCMLPCLSRLTT